jgi:thiosulfate dehydrogenase (quinone) large subunit
METSTLHATESSRATESSSPRYSDAVIAYTILRLSFGANIMLHGVSRLMAGHAAFLAYLTHYFEKTPLIPASVLPMFATVLPPVETALGLLLLLGVGTRFSLIAGSLVMAALVVGTNLAQDWNVAGLQLIYCFIYYYLLTHRRELNRISLDALIGW